MVVVRRRAVAAGVALAVLLAAAGAAWIWVRGRAGGAPAAELQFFGDGPPRVLLVHTHAYEGYAAASEAGPGARPPSGTRGAGLAGPALAARDARAVDVVGAAALLGRALAARGVAAVHDRGFGRPASGGAGAALLALDAYDPYGAARPRLQRLLRQFPSVELVIDVHRDALDHKDATAAYRGRPAARLLWVVGSLPVRGADWWPNLRAAALLTERLQRTAPELVRGIWVKPGPYNQDLGRVSALIEIGGDGSRPDEVARAIDPLADAVAWYLELPTETRAGRQSGARAGSAPQRHRTSAEPAATASAGMTRPLSRSPYTAFPR